MTIITVGSIGVEVPDSLDLVPTSATAPQTTGPTSLEKGLRWNAFMALFPDAEDPERVVPVPDMDVFVLDADEERSSEFVHVAQYRKSGRHFESDGGWFERDEVALWAYVPNIDNEAKRRIGS